MIAADAQTRQTAAMPALDAPAAAARLPDWQQELAAAVRDPLELLALVDLAPTDLGEGVTAESLRAAARDFPLRVPRGFIARMRRGDPLDPLLRQVLSLPDELQVVEGYSADPLHEADVRRAPGVLRKYRGRALLVTTGACAVHCRYCFRRHYDYGADQAEGSRWSTALAQIARDDDVDEVILSGGDPLSLGNARLALLLQSLATLPRVKRLRIHTRNPIVLPARVDEALLQMLAPWRERLVVVVHANHPAEIDAPTAAALRRLQSVSAALLNQSVLLAGVNDDADALAALSMRLFESGALPYYLHQLDAVAGAAHFAVDDERALSLHARLIALLPGYLVPRLVRETAGAPGKLPVALDAAVQRESTPLL